MILKEIEIVLKTRHVCDPIIFADKDAEACLS